MPVPVFGDYLTLGLKIHKDPLHCPIFDEIMDKFEKLPHFIGFYFANTFGLVITSP